MYACFLKSTGSGRLVTAASAGPCPNPSQYVGKMVTGVDSNVLAGVSRFPADPILAQSEAAAKISAASGPFSNDAIVFGRWRD